MVRTRRWSAALAACVALLVCLALAGLIGCGSDDGNASSGSGTLRVGVRANVTGFGYYNEEAGKYSGLEIDIADEMASRMGYADVEFITATPETRKEQLLNGDVDCLVACYSIAETRLENFDFSPAYYEDVSVIMVQNSSLFDDIEDLKDCTFGTVAGSNAAAQLDERLAEIGFTSGEPIKANEDNSDVQFDNFHLVQMTTYQELSEALEEGAIDAACMDGAISYTYMNDERHLLDFQIATQEYGVATQKDSALSEPVSETIQGMLDDGTIAWLIDKWD